jgi:hypothetical protein
MPGANLELESMINQSILGANLELDSNPDRGSNGVVSSCSLLILIAFGRMCLRLAVIQMCIIGCSCTRPR